MKDLWIMAGLVLLCQMLTTYRATAQKHSEDPTGTSNPSGSSNNASPYFIEMQQRSHGIIEGGTKLSYEDHNGETIPTHGHGSYWKQIEWMYPESYTNDYTMFNSAFLTSQIHQVPWIYPHELNGALPYTPAILNACYSSSGGLYRNSSGRNYDFIYNGRMIQRRFRISSTSADHPPLRVHALKVSNSGNYWWILHGVMSVTAVEPFEVVLPAGAKKTDWIQLDAPLVDGGATLVGLYPVDLDIIHPATGELAEDREDGANANSPDGGYVSIKRTVGSDAIEMSGEDVAPVTKLSIKGIYSSSPTKVRLKFNAGDRYKIYKDEWRTEEVVSEQTEFEGNQETILYFQGLKKSLSRGGEKISMQVKMTDTWVDGDSVQCTVVQSEFLVQIKAFIPYEWTEGESVWLINGVNPMNGKVAHGDYNVTNRPTFKNEFSDKDSFYSVAPFRLCHEVVLTPYPDLHYFYQDLEANRKFTSALSSDHYNKAASVDASELALRNGYLLLTPPSIASGRPVLSPATYAPEMSLYNIFRKNKCALDLSASGKDGAMGVYTAASPAIDWDVRLEIDASLNTLQPSIRVVGEHDLYPAYEIIVLQADETFKDVHRHMPSRNVYPGPLSLSTASPITFDNFQIISN